MRATVLNVVLGFALVQPAAQKIAGTLQGGTPRELTAQAVGGSPAAPTPSPLAQQAAPQQNCAKVPEETQHGQQWTDKVNAYSTLAIAFFTVVSACILCVQISTARRTDRAWVIVNPIEYAPPLGFVREAQLGNIKNRLIGADEKNLFQCSIKNTGNTPARLLEISLSYKLATNQKDIPRRPDYGERSNLNSLVLVKDDSIGYETVLEPRDILTWDETESVRNRKTFLYAYGLVTYKDAFNRKHETRFGYLYHFPQGGDRRKAQFMREELPTPYNTAT